MHGLDISRHWPSSGTSSLTHLIWDHFLKHIQQSSSVIEHYRGWSAAVDTLACPCWPFHWGTHPSLSVSGIPGSAQSLKTIVLPNRDTEFATSEAAAAGNRIFILNYEFHSTKSISSELAECQDAKHIIIKKSNSQWGRQPQHKPSQFDWQDMQRWMKHRCKHQCLLLPPLFRWSICCCYCQEQALRFLWPKA